MNKISFWQEMVRFIQSLALKPIYEEKPKSNLYPPFEDTIEQLIFLARKEGLNVDLFEGFRSFKRQAELYAKGRTKKGRTVTKARPGHSWHNFGLAADIVFKKKNKWSWAKSHNWEKLGRLGKSLGLRWGGDWKSKDYPHFYWPTKLNKAQARVLFKQGLNHVWKQV